MSTMWKTVFHSNSIFKTWLFVFFMMTAGIIVLYPIKLLPMTKDVNYGKIMFIFSLHTKWFKRRKAKPKCALEWPARSNTSSIFKMLLKTEFCTQACMWWDYFITILIFFLHILLYIVLLCSTYILTHGFCYLKGYFWGFFSTFCWCSKYVLYVEQYNLL